jgi:hypothetical protein
LTETRGNLKNPNPLRNHMIPDQRLETPNLLNEVHILEHKGFGQLPLKAGFKKVNS